MPLSLLKKAALPSCLSLKPCCRGTPSERRRRTQLGWPPQPSRGYADVQSDRTYEFRDNMNWPCRKARPWTPSPYDIFDLDRTGTYSKQRFYELVKIYHPDRVGAAGAACGISHVERLERYRLVVQAHQILSDPVKRRAFDMSGVGWGANGPASRHSRGFTNGEGKQYGFGPDDDSSIFQNATWEDWERWYRRHDNPAKQAYAGTYLHPNAFASFVILLAVVSGVFQATRVGQFSGQIEEKAKAFTEETSQFLASRADHYQENQLGRDGRIKHFLEKRDPSKYGLKDAEEDAYRHHFANPHMAPSPTTVKHSDPG